MIGDYLNESYEDDLVESIFEEVSEETWEAIEEAILNELSPELLQRYKQKAKKSVDKLDSKAQKSDDLAMKTFSSAMRKNVDSKGHKSDYEKSTKYSDQATKYHNKSKQRDKGIETAEVKLIKSDLNNLSADEFQKKYRMSKAEWERKNK
jgi:hypothetical protein